jgi:hypothetical protein
MKVKIITLALFVTLFANNMNAQHGATVNALNADISDNLDLRAVASIFGESTNLDDFENRLNNPKFQISNLDLNKDGQVDYLRVIESVEDRTHLIIIQSVLNKDVFQDIATIEVEKDFNNNVQIQVVGNAYMYGQNYIYEPIYVHHPLIFSLFWTNAYRPYYSPWYWNYYPVYYSPWNPYPIFRYRRNINVYINHENHYNYVNIRRSERAVNLYGTRRTDGYERMYPERSFNQRNTTSSNHYELDQTRNNTPRGGRNESQVRDVNTPARENNNPVRVETPTRTNETPRNTPTRSESPTPVRSEPTRTNETPRNTPTRSEAPAPVRTEPTRSNESPRNTPTRSEAPRSTPSRSEMPRNEIRSNNSNQNNGGNNNSAPRGGNRRG